MVEKHVAVGGCWGNDFSPTDLKSPVAIYWSGRSTPSYRDCVTKRPLEIERPVLALRSGLPAKVELLVFQHLSVRVCRLMVDAFRAQ